MTKNPDDKIITPLPNAQPEVQRLDIQTAANFLAGCNRLGELANQPNYQPEHDAEAKQIKTELGHFVSAHAVALTQGWLNYAAILVPLQQSFSALVTPCVARALSERFDNSKGVQANSEQP